jgi:hypothetical protein
MKITEKQLQMLMVILQDSQANIVGFFSYSQKTRSKLLDEIINQQSNEIINLKSSNKIEISKRSLSDIKIEYNHPSGKMKGYLKYDDDEETLILQYNGGFITLPSIEDCNVL